ncbi:MAG: hypothetical protein Q9222_004078 [Ikaeria aurantiellina]
MANIRNHEKSQEIVPRYLGYAECTWRMEKEHPTQNEAREPLIKRKFFENQRFRSRLQSCLFLALVILLWFLPWNLAFPDFGGLFALLGQHCIQTTDDMSTSVSTSAISNISCILSALLCAVLSLTVMFRWVDEQMHLMSNGLAGHEHDFYPVVSNSKWLGGIIEYSGLNEGLPYWLNGLVPLAYGLDDERLKSQIDDVVDYVLDYQQADGWLGPEISSDRDIWARFPLCLGLMQLVEADPSKSSRLVPALYKFITLMHNMLANNIGYKQFWGRVRYPDMIITLQWLYERYPSNNTATLLETMSLLNQYGLRWADYYTPDEFIFKDLDLIKPPITGNSDVFPHVHAVNAAQGMKAGAVI